MYNLGDSTLSPCVPIKLLVWRPTSNSGSSPSYAFDLKSNLLFISVKKSYAPLMYRSVGLADEKYFFANSAHSFFMLHFDGSDSEKFKWRVSPNLRISNIAMSVLKDFFLWNRRKFLDILLLMKWLHAKNSENARISS